MQQPTRWAGTRSESLCAPPDRMGRWLLASSLLCLLVACSGEGPAQRLDNYLTRLARTIDQTTPDPEAFALSRSPRSAALQIALPGSSLDALDFLALSGCKVQTTIGKRNSSLGRFARPSQRLLLELEYLRLAPECITLQRGKGERELADQLQSAWDLKRKQLPALIYNATLGSEEYRDFWRPGSDTATSSSVITALEAIHADASRWLAGNFEADNLTFELQLSEVRKGDGGRLVAALAAQAGWLAAADQVIANRLRSGALCSGGLRPASVDVLGTVIRKYFVGEVQPDAAALGRRYHELMPPLQALEQLLTDVEPALYRDWARQRDRSLEDWNAAPRDHVQSLQQILEPCGGLGGAS
ncbi:MAG: DUF3080 family protein [Pseudomonadota bacterium]